MKRAGLLLAIAMSGMLMATTAFGAKESRLLAQRYGINGYSIAYSENSEITFENYGIVKAFLGIDASWDIKRQH